LRYGENDANVGRDPEAEVALNITRKPSNRHRLEQKIQIEDTYHLELGIFRRWGRKSVIGIFEEELGLSRLNGLQGWCCTEKMIYSADQKQIVYFPTA
jgi:hypothetical protein